MSEMKPDPRQKLAPTWLIVTHLLGAAIMLYFVSYPSTRLTPEPQTNAVINVAELHSHAIVGRPSPPTNNTYQKQKVVD